MDNNYNKCEISTRQSKQINLLIAYVDSDHATDTSHCQSVSGFHIKLTGATILYEIKYQSIVAQSSTKAELIAVVEAGRHILYLRTMMQEIGLPQDHVTIMYEDNQGTLLMVQAGQPTNTH